MNSMDLAEGLVNTQIISSIDGVPRFDSCISANTVFVLTHLKRWFGYVSSLANKIDVADGIQY